MSDLAYEVSRLSSRDRKIIERVLEHHAGCRFVLKTEFRYYFYNPEPRLDLGHKHYFGIRVTEMGEVYISDGSEIDGTPIEDKEWQGAILPNGIVVVSLYRHDYREIGYTNSKGEQSTFMIDGDSSDKVYRFGGNSTEHRFGKLIIKDGETYFVVE